jgi:soluble P-type ATPase
MNDEPAKTSRRDTGSEAAFCMNCFAPMSATDTVCPVCHSGAAALSARDYRDKLLRALEHPLADVRVRAIHALRLRADEAAADALAQCALKHPVDVVQGLLVIAALRAIRTSADGRGALARLSTEHPAHAIRHAAGVALADTSVNTSSEKTMLEIRIPGRAALRLEHLVLDFNGTLACDGVLLAGVAERIERLAKQLQIHVVTGDTFGAARRALTGVPCELTILPAQAQAEGKRAFVERLNPRTVCIGNGNNDRLMLQSAALAIAVIQQEGAALAALQACDVIVRDIADALELLLNPTRLIATLRG